VGPDTLIRRKFVYLGGYYPQTPEVAFARFQRDLAHFAKTWGIAATASALTIDEHCSRWNVETCGPGWRVETEHVLVRWDDLIDADRQRSWPRRLWQGLSAGADFLWHGAVPVRYVTARLALCAVFSLSVSGCWLALCRSGRRSCACPAAAGHPARLLEWCGWLALGLLLPLIAVLGGSCSIICLTTGSMPRRMVRHGDTALRRGWTAGSGTDVRPRTANC
jgi:hypothetical protein